MKSDKKITVVIKTKEGNMKVGSLVKLKNTDRLGTVIKVDSGLVEVRLLSGSLVIAHESFFELK